MPQEDKTIAVEKSQLQTLQVIQELIAQAHKEFQTLPNELQEKMFELHNEGTSLNHCLRWGEQACEDLTAACRVAPGKRPGR